MYNEHDWGGTEHGKVSGLEKYQVIYLRTLRERQNSPQGK